MKLTFTPLWDNMVHVYCISCQAEDVMFGISITNRRVYCCLTCEHQSDRALVIDPEVAWWVDEEGNYCHHTAGMFLHDGQGRFLFFSRAKFPYGLTLPAGHTSPTENPLMTALRETWEETTVTLGFARHVGTVDIDGDECPRGADMHRWDMFMGELPVGALVSINSSEGYDPVWLTLEEALHYPLTEAVRYVITQFGHLVA